MQRRCVQHQKRTEDEQTHLGLEGRLGKSLLSLQGSGTGLGTHDTTTPVLSVLFELVVEVGLDSSDKSSKLLLVLSVNLGQGNSGSSLLVHQSTKTGLGLDNAVWDTHLAAESRQPKDKFNRVNIVSNDNELSLLGLDKSGDVVDTVLDVDRLLTLVNSGASSGSLSKLLQSQLLLDLGFRAVLVEQLEQLSGGVLVQGLGELVD